MLDLLWAALRPGGILFIYETPHRWWPIEAHTTGLPLLNYLPDALALVAARKFSRRVDAGATWAELLRRGIRGGTDGEIMGILRTAGRSAVLLQPSENGIGDRIDLWYRMSSGLGHGGAKRVVREGMKALKAATGVTLVPYLSLAVRKSR